MLGESLVIETSSSASTSSIECSRLSTALAFCVRFDTPASQSRTSSGMPGCSVAILRQIASAFFREPAAVTRACRRRSSVLPALASNRSAFCTSPRTRETASDDTHISGHSCALNHSLTTDNASYVLSLPAVREIGPDDCMRQHGHLSHHVCLHRWRFTAARPARNPRSI